MTTQDLHDLRELFAMSVLTGDKPDLTKSDCEMVVAAVERLHTAMKFAQHKPDCVMRQWLNSNPGRPPCDCGYREFLNAIPDPPKVSV